MSICYWIIAWLVYYVISVFLYVFVGKDIIENQVNIDNYSWK